MPTIAIVNEKGGTAKTTTAVSLSAAMGGLGQRVLLVDLDGQAAASRWLGVEEDNRLADAMIAGGGLEPIPNVAPNVSLAPATGKLDSVAHDLRPSQGGQLRKILKRVQDEYDLVVLDCPPSLGNRLIGNALLAATHALVPVETSILALDGLKILLTTLEDIREGFGHSIVLAGVLACRFDGRTRLSRLVLEELRRSLPGKVFQTVIRENVRMRECPASGESIYGFAPDSNAAQDYMALAKEMLTHPDAWQQPAVWHLEAGNPSTTATEQCAIASLRDNAAASVRAAAGKSAATDPREALPTPERRPPDEPPAAAPDALSAPAADTSPAPPRTGPEQTPPPPRPADAPGEAVPRFGGPNPWAPPSQGPPALTWPPPAQPASEVLSPVASTASPLVSPQPPQPGMATPQASAPRPEAASPVGPEPTPTAQDGASDAAFPNLTAYLDRLVQAKSKLDTAKTSDAQAPRPEPEPEPELTARPLPAEQPHPQAAPPAETAETAPQLEAAKAPIPPGPAPSPADGTATVPNVDEEAKPEEEVTPLTRLLQQQAAEREQQDAGSQGNQGRFPALQALLRRMRGQDHPEEAEEPNSQEKEAEAVGAARDSAGPIGGG